MDGVFSGEILVGSTDTDTVLPSGGTIPSRRVLWLPYVHFPLYARGNPRTRWSGQQRLAFLLEGVAWNFDNLVRGSGWIIFGGRSGLGSPSFTRSALVSIFFFGHVFVVAPAFSFHSRLLLVVSCGCYINIAGRKSISRRINYDVSLRVRTIILI
jgi:hypothetical protein